MKNSCEVAIVGGGPGGLTAGFYLARARIKSLLLEEKMPGGQASLSPLIENYPGIPQGMPGLELVRQMQEQAEGAGLEISSLTPVSEISLADNEKHIQAGDQTVKARAVIIATGAVPKKLGVPGEEELTGRGVSYCATCDGPLFTGKVVLVVGGGNAAVEEALHLTQHASKVTIVHRRDKLRATKILQERALRNPKLEFIWDSHLVDIKGDKFVESAVVENTKTGEKREILVSGIFLYVGNEPNSGFVKDLVETDDRGYILTDDRLETSVPGIFAAGDVRANHLKQIVVAAGEGALAAVSAQRYLGNMYA